MLHGVKLSKSLVILMVISRISSHQLGFDYAALFLGVPAEQVVSLGGVKRRKKAAGGTHFFNNIFHLLIWI